MNTLVPPPPKHLDAFNRAVRTFVQGLISAVLAAVVPVVLASTGQIHLTKEWLVGLLALIGTAAMTAALSYVARYVKPPQP